MRVLSGTAEQNTDVRAVLNCKQRIRVKVNAG